MKTTDQLKYSRAKKRFSELKSFYIMILGSCLLIPFLIFLNYRVNPNVQWFWFPIFGIAISIINYSFHLFVGKKWEAKKIRELMTKNQFKN